MAQTRHLPQTTERGPRWLWVGALSLLVLPGCVDIVATDASRFVEREEKRFTVTGRPDVALSTFDGSIEIRSWDRAEVLVVVEKRAGSKEGAAGIEIVAEQVGNSVTVEAKVQPHDGFDFTFHSRSARLIVSLPASSDVRAKSGDGRIDIERVSGRLGLHSGDGSIRGRDLAGELSVQTGDGSIRLEQASGSLEATTGDGSIAVVGALTAVRVRTGDGSVTIHAAPGSAAGADWDVVTGDGSVRLNLPDGFNGELDAHTGDGAVVTRDLTISNVPGRTRKNTVRGRLGEGGHTVRVRTGDGRITLGRFHPSASAAP